MVGSGTIGGSGPEEGGETASDDLSSLAGANSPERHRQPYTQAQVDVLHLTANTPENNRLLARLWGRTEAAISFARRWSDLIAKFPAGADNRLKRQFVEARSRYAGLKPGSNTIEGALALVRAGSRESEPAPANDIALLIDPGDATAEELAELFTEVSILYRMIGGSGVSFVIADAKEPAVA